MPSYAYAAAALAALSAAPLVAAHGFVSGVVSDGQYYSGTSPNWIYGEKPATAGWYAENQDNGFVAPSTYTTGDIICHKAATNGEGSIPVTAGQSIDLQWNTWPESHHGPVINYMASCGGDCTTVDKATLKWFKIDEAGLNDGTTAPGTWASDDLIANNFTASAKIPADIAPGAYVLRHEIIALHSAGQEDGAQNYPQCLNVEVSGSGSASPEGVEGTALYTPTDAGILVNIYQSLSSYEIPGPAVYGGGASSGSGSGSSTGSGSGSTTTATPSNNSTGTASSTAASVNKTPVKFCA